MKQKSDRRSRLRCALTGLDDRLEGNDPCRPSPSPVEQVLAALQPQIEELRLSLKTVTVVQNVRPVDQADAPSGSGSSI